MVLAQAAFVSFGAATNTSGITKYARALDWARGEVTLTKPGQVDGLQRLAVVGKRQSRQFGCCG